MRSLPCVLFSALSLVAQTQAPTARIAAEALTGSVLCYDAARQRLVVRTRSMSLWEHDGRSWGLVALPGPTSGHVIYDASRQRVLFVDTAVREYDGHTIVSRGPSPSPLRVVADVGRSRLVGLTFPPGGSVNGIEIIEWDGAVWGVVAAMPGIRTPLSICFDPVRGRTLMQVIALGGTSTFETWEWDGTTLHGPFGDGLSRLSCVFDPTRGQVIGLGPAGMWSWDGARWSALPAVVTPRLTFLATDPVNRVVWAIDGDGPDQIWAWNGTSWSPALLGPIPPAYQPSLTFDSARRRGVLLGYTFDVNEDRLQAEWDGVEWTRLPLGAVAPATFRRHAQAYDPVRAETIVFGGMDRLSGLVGDTFAWDGANWRLAATTGPSPRLDAAITYDSRRSRVVLVGGNGAGPTGPMTVADHWEWDGTAWTQVAATTPMATALILGFDPIRNRLVAHTEPRSTFEFDGVRWQMVASGGPRLGASRQLVWNPDRNALQATLNDNSSVPTTFLWDGVAWSATTAPIGEHMYDTARGTLFTHTVTATSVYSASHATTVDFGAGCGGSGTTTSLVAFRSPRFGDRRFHLDVRADATHRPVLLGFAASTGNMPLGNGCSLLLQNPVATQVWFTDAAGFLHYPVPVPYATALRGGVLHAQAAVLDPASPGGLAMTQGLTLTIGD